MKKLHAHQVYILLLWLGMVLISFFSRFYFPLDETRYVTVAWNMWLRQDYLVPFLNGEAYSHKPPLLFWLINLGWAIFGVNDWWPRLVPSFFALGSLLITQQIARRLWPQRPQLSISAALILLGSALWALFTTAVMFDILVAFFTVLGVLGLLNAWQTRSYSGWVMVAIAIGGGLLAKGPAVLLQVLPLALLAPWWMTNRGDVSNAGVNLRWWYLSLAFSVVAGLLILLAWAIPAGMAGGAVYQHDIFWGQTAYRVVKSFAHSHPFWYYLQIAPLILFPWLFALPVWRALSRLPAIANEPGIRVCLAWFIPVLIAFSMISGKQPHYLLPIFPAFALLVARGLDDVRVVSLVDKYLLLLIGIALGLVLAALPIYASSHHMAPWFKDISPTGGGVLILGLLLLFFLSQRTLLSFIWASTLMSCLIITVLYTSLIGAAGPAYDLRNISAQLKLLENQNIPLAYVGKYHGQFNFIGRLSNSPHSLHQPDLTAWFDKNPQGRAIVFFTKGRPWDGMHVEFLQNYRGGKLGILTRQQWLTWSARHQLVNTAEEE